MSPRSHSGAAKCACHGSSVSPDYIVPTLDKARWLFKIVPTSLATWQGVEWAKKYKD